MMNDMQTYLYHGLNANIRDSVDTLEMILKSGYLMTRKSLREYLSASDWELFLEKHFFNWNGLNAISIACHPNNRELIERYQLLAPYAVSDDAYKKFISGATTLILDSCLLEDYSIKKDSFKMEHELQILGDIPISYIKAIGIKTTVDVYKNPFSPKYIYRLKKSLEAFQYGNVTKKSEEYYRETWVLREALARFNLEEIYSSCIYTSYIPRLKEVLELYQFDVPIVDLEYGYELTSAEQQKKRIKKLKTQYLQYIQDK